MKKLFKYFVFPLCVSFALLVSVDAGICGGAYFEESSTPFPCVGEAPVRLCLHQHDEGPKQAEKGPFDSVPAAKGSCETTLTTKQNKHMVTVHIGPCGDDQVKIDWTCTFNYYEYNCPEGYYEDDIGCTDGKGNYVDYVQSTASGETTYKDQAATTVDSQSEYETKTCTGGRFNCSCDKSIYLRYEYYDVVCDEVGIAPVCVNGEEFVSSGEDAFCINPSYLAPESGSTWDTTFEVTDCKNARTSKDCGYANILIEGDRLGFSYGVINVALRLWGADETFVFDPAAGGFDDTGLPIQGDADDPIDGERNFREPFVNVYKHTVAAIQKYLRAGVKIEDITEDNYRSYLKKIACDTTNGIGELCGDDDSYLDAIYLYINTIQGNPYMIDHLNEKFKNLGYDTSEYKILSDAKVSNYKEEERIIEITEILAEDVEVECDILDEANKEYCRMPKQKIYTYINGQKVLLADSTSEELYYSYCKKNRCIVEVETPVAICDEVSNERTKIIYIEWDEEQKITERSVKKFISCSSTTANKEQIMFVYDIEDRLNETSSSTPHSDTIDGGTTKEIKYVCKCEDNQYDGPDVQAYGAGNFDKAVIDNAEVATISVNGSGINNTCGNINKEGKYSSNNEYGNGPYDTLTKSSVFEPSLAKILNMCRKSKKEVYDYSDYYGINSKVCKLYCRDEVTFYLANKTKSSDGNPFKYDINMRLKTLDNLIPNQVRSGKKYNYYLVNGNRITTLQENKDDPKLLTSVVMEQRECVTEIFMHKENEDGDTFYDLYSKARAQGEQKQLIYDLENCNLYSGGNSNLNNHRINVDVVVQAINLSIDEKYTTIDYLNKTVNSCDVDKNCPSMNLTYSDVDGERNVNIGMEHGLYISNVGYCNNDGNNKCYEYYYDSGSKTAQDKLGGTHNFKTTSVNVIGAGSVQIPNNDYATFTINKEYDFYNNTTYYAKVGNGDITTEEGENRVKIDDYAYPIHATTIPTSYPVTEKYTIGTTLYRKKKNDDFNKLLSKIKTYSCYVDVDDGSEECSNQCCKSKDCDNPTPSYGLGFSFKNIEPSNMFPGTDTDPDWKGVYALNWDTPEATRIQNQIEASSRFYYTDDEYLDYSVTLTPENIRRIKKYNKDNNNRSLFSTKGYTNNTLYACSNPDENGGLLLNCKSTFVNSIREGEFGFGFNTVGGND